jgi:hypothetical protein
MATIIIKRSGKKKKKEISPPINTKTIKKIENKIREMDSNTFYRYLNSNTSIFD